MPEQDTMPYSPMPAPSEIPAPADAPRDEPSLSLPKAGGAIRGMGEKFTTNPVTGTASLSVPVALTPGRPGAAPALTLSYDSGAGNSAFGLGWSLGVPAISRRTDKGVPRYVDDGPGADVFQLTGAEDLVPAEFPAPRTDSGYEVRSYRPRTEGLFSRIERWRDPVTGATHWQVTSKDNVTSVFGRGPATVVADPAGPARVFSWLLEEVRDDRGNVVRYEYKADGAARHLKRVRYGLRQRGVEGDFCFEAVLDYGEHADDTPSSEEVRPWRERLDPFSTRRPGFEVRTARLCRRVLMFHHVPELASGAVLVASTDLAHQDDPASTKLVSVTRRGYLASGSGYREDHLPPMTFEYTPRTVSAGPAELRTAQGDAPPRSGSAYQWVDLDGEGIAGLLTEQDGTWYYRRNLGDGRIGTPRVVDPLPAGAALGRGRQLMDLAGDGRPALTELAGVTPGFHRRTDDGGWAGFTTFSRLPVLDWSDPNLRFVDLTGDGMADLLRTGSDGFAWNPSLGTDGFGDQVEIAAERSEERGPRLLFADAEQSVYLADMTGDGLTDFVRVRNGELSYWPSLGHGRFGARIAMAGAPVFDHPDRFDQRRVRLSDVDGSAPADLLYLGPDGVRVWFNQAGNSWSEPESVDTGFAPDLAGSVGVADLLGRGTACLVVAQPRPDGEPQISYVDLMASGKPHLMSTVDNGMGLRTTTRYESSTTYYLADAAAGSPWLTSLPFPVHVVAETTTRDDVADATLVASFRYRHGFYDGVEREFRGFGYVEQRDSLSLFGPTDRLYQPSAVKKRWQHTGWYAERDRITGQFRDEYWQAGAGPRLLETALPDGLDTEEEREAARALRGSVLREEVYTEDADGDLGKPYQFSESSYAVRVLQPRGQTYAVVFVQPGEQLSVHTERRPDDPRITHTLTLDVDEWGNVKRSAQIAYGRVGGEGDQAKTYVVLSEHEFVNDVGPERWCVGVGFESREYELGGLPQHGGLFAAADLTADFFEIPYQDQISGARLERRLLARTQQTYASADQSTELLVGETAVPVLPWRSYKQAFGPGQVTALYGDRVDDAVLTGAGYLQREGVWWAPSGRQVFDAGQFCLPVAYLDPFGARWQIGYDRHLLRPVRVGDPAGNVTQAALNYRVLQPWLLTDANNNRTAVRFDLLGMVVATALMGKGEGDTLDLSTVEPSDGDRPTTYLEYDLHQKPVRFHTFARERHGDANPRWQQSWTYSDGTGRTILVKSQAEPAPGQHAARWVGTGRTIYDNKGNPVKKYEPYFAADGEFDTEPSLVQRGVTSILRYDPLGRLIGTDYPDGTLSKVELGTWENREWDRNDTVLESSWYAKRIALPSGDARRQAAEATTPHANTPSVSKLDSLAHVHVSVADNGGGVLLKTTVERDVQGHELTVTDARGVRVLTQRFGMLGHAAHAVGADSGERWSLPDVTGKPVRGWDARGTELRWKYDNLRRQTHAYATFLNGVETLRVRTFFGESAPDGAAHNLRTRPCAIFDGAGLLHTVDVDFKGNALDIRRQLVADAFTEPDWSSLAGITDVGAALAAAATVLETTSHSTLTEYDALSRVTLVTSADGSRTRPTYNEANLLERMETQVGGTGQWIPFVGNLDYNARGQRTLIELGNGVKSAYGYEDDTFRLSSVDTRGVANLQALRFTYDPVGNIVRSDDPVQETVFYANNAVGATRTFGYEPIYRLSTATGREHIGQTGQPGPAEPSFGPLPHANDSTALRSYTESYGYDDGGNITQVTHVAADGSWSRTQAYATDSNRLLAAQYTHDANGNLTSMPHLATLDWDADNRLVHADLGGGGDAYYQYDSSGARVRAVVRNGGTVETRVYLGQSELYRKVVAGTTRLERETLHISDGTQRVALVETTTVDNGSPSTVQRYQLSDHLGSSTVELSDTGAVLTYEEYHPYGTTSFQSTPDSSVSRKRYRFTGKEKDLETGFYYHGARYYAPWLGRWISSDPAGFVDGPNTYAYVRGNPIRMTDPSGNQTFDPSAPPPPAQGFGLTVDAKGLSLGPLSPGPGADELSGTRAPAPEPAPAAAASPEGSSFKDSEVVQGAAGLLYGVGQAFAPLGFLAPSPLKGSKVFEYFRGAGQVATGIAQIFAGAGMIGGGGASAAGGLAAAPVTGGASLLVTLGGGGVVLAGMAAVAQGLSNVGAGILTMQNAAAMSGGGSGGGGSDEPPPSAPPPSNAGKSVVQQANEAGVREEIPEGPLEIVVHGTEEKIGQEMIETQGGNLSKSGGTFGGKLYTTQERSVADVFAQRTAQDVGGRPVLVGIALPLDVANRLRKLQLLVPGRITNPPIGVRVGAPEWVFQPGAIPELQKHGFFFQVH